MDKKELEIYEKVVHEKYRLFRLWKMLAIVFICLTLVLSVLLFANGDLFRQTINANEVEIVNEGDDNSNNVVINN